MTQGDGVFFVWVTHQFNNDLDGLTEAERLAQTVQPPGRQTTWHSLRLATVAASAGTLHGRTDVWAEHHLQSISQQLFAIPQHFFGT